MAAGSGNSNNTNTRLSCQGSLEVNGGGSLRRLLGDCDRQG